MLTRLLPLAVLLSTAAKVLAGSTATGADQVLEQLPACSVKCYYAALGHSTNNSTSPITDFCYQAGIWGNIQDCVLQQCSTFDRYKIIETESTLCDQPAQTWGKRFYLILIAEIAAWICPWLRFFASWKSPDGIHREDYIMLVCGVFYTVYIFCVHHVQYSLFDANPSTFNSGDVSSALELLFVAENFVLLCLALAKITILHAYLRAFSGTRVKVAAYMTMALITIPTIVLFFVLTFRCSPVSFSWNGWSTNSKSHQCVNVKVLAYTKQIFDIVQNSLLILLPLPLIPRLSLDFGKKVGTVVVFAVSGLALAMSCLRLQFFLSNGAKSDEPWQYGDHIIWTGVEISTLIVIACLPNIWKFLPTTYSRKRAALMPHSPGLRRRPTDKPLPPIHSKSKSSDSTAIYSAKGGLTESNIELDVGFADKSRGNVWTQIKGGHRFSSFSVISHVSDKLGIRVKTTTTTRVDFEEEDEFESGHIVKPARGPLSP